MGKKERKQHFQTSKFSENDLDFIIKAAEAKQTEIKTKANAKSSDSKIIDSSVSVSIESDKSSKDIITLTEVDEMTEFTDNNFIGTTMSVDVKDKSIEYENDNNDAEITRFPEGINTDNFVPKKVLSALNLMISFNLKNVNLRAGKNVVSSPKVRCQT